MNLKKLLAFLTVYAVIIISVPLFFNEIWLKDFPELEIYEGELKFSGERAYKDVEYIGINFPQREVGSEYAESSANWILHEFNELGLDSYKEEFSFKSLKKLFSNAVGENGIDDGNSERLAMGNLYLETKGINVIGISKGKSKETIVIGAHRDTLGTLEGAQDNASGTAAMLELARVLSGEEHYYTYMFISFDGEEFGLKGSEAFARNNSLKNIKLVMILDCVGYKHADTVGLYQFASSKGASPLWTTVLANNIIKRSGGKTYYIDDEGGFSGVSIGVFPSLLEKMISLKVSGGVNTDSGPFVDRNIPSVGFIAANSGKIVDEEGLYHTPGDTISMVSKETLDFVGKLAEQYIKSVELNDFPGELKSSWYLVKDNKYMGYRTIFAFSLLVILGVILFWYISFFEVWKKRRDFLDFVKKEVPWIISIVILSIFYGFTWQVLKMDFAANLNIVLVILLWLAVNFFGLLAIIAMRFVIIKDKRNKYYKITNFQRVLLNSLYFVIFIAVTICFNIFVAITLVGIPILVLGRVCYKNAVSRVVWGIVLFAWFIAETVLLFICLIANIFDILAVQTSVLMFIYSLLVNFSFMYIISTPLMPKKTENLI